MPLYFFNVYDGVARIDPDGTDLQNLEAARVEAVCLAGHILRDYAKDIIEGDDWHLEVADRRGLILFRLDVQATDAPAIRPDPLKRR